MPGDLVQVISCRWSREHCTALYGSFFWGQLAQKPKHSGRTIYGRMRRKNKYLFMYLDALLRRYGGSGRGREVSPRFCKDAASGSSFNPITTRRADYSHRITASPPRLENLAASLFWQKRRRCWTSQRRLAALQLNKYETDPDFLQIF